MIKPILLIMVLLLVSGVCAQQSKPLFDAAAYQKQQAKKDLQPRAKSKTSRAFAPLVAAAIGCGLFDSFSTERGLRRGFTEGNPLLRGSTVRRQGIAWGARAGLLVMFLKLRRKNPQAVNVGVGGLAAWGCGAGAWNVTR